MKRLFLRTGLTLGSLLLAGQALWAAPTSYEVDPAHSGINFSVRHFFSPVQGKFRSFTGTIRYDQGHPEDSSVSFTVQSASIDTDNEKRDGHLKSPDFFDVAKFPTLTFESKKVTPDRSNRKRLNVTGTLTLHGVSQNVTIPVTLLGTGKGMMGPIAGFEADFEVNRKDYGIVWNKALDGGGTMLGDDVQVKVTIEAGAKP
jgi:polyisoprenoid-binding protein YceI